MAIRKNPEIFSVAAAQLKMAAGEPNKKIEKLSPTLARKIWR